MQFVIDILTDVLDVLQVISFELSLEKYYEVRFRVNKINKKIELFKEGK